MKHLSVICKLGCASGLAALALGLLAFTPSFSRSLAPAADTCFATHNDGGTVFSGNSAHVVQQAVDAATTGTVKVAGYCPHVEYIASAGVGQDKQSVYIDKPLTLRGGYTTTNWTVSDPIAYPTVLDPQTGRGIVISGVVATVENLTVQNGWVKSEVAYAYADRGGGILATGALTLTNVRVLSSTAEGAGGGVYSGGVARATGGLLQNNRCAGSGCDGGGWYADGDWYAGDSLTLLDTQVISNAAVDFGGGLYAAGALTLTHAHVLTNTAGDGGGGVYVLGDLAVSGGLFQDNQCTGSDCQGGGVYAVVGGYSYTILNGAQFIGNTAAGGSGAGGGGLAAEREVQISGGLFQSNRCTLAHCIGGGMWVWDSVLTGVQFISNTTAITYGDGGGIWAIQVQVSDSLFRDNEATLGGGISASRAYVSGCVFQGNRGHKIGGGVATQSDLVVSDSQFIGNAAGSGGGVYAEGSSGRATNTLFARNDADSALHTDAGEFTLVHATIAGPASGDATAVCAGDGLLAITNTIIVSYTTDLATSTSGQIRADYCLFSRSPVIEGNVTLGAHNHIDPAATAFVNPSTDDYRLAPANPARDRGVDAGVAADLDGNPRPWPSGGGFDIGAYEYTRWPIYLPLALRDF